MYSERVLTADLAPPLAGATVANGENQAPFVFGDYRPNKVTAVVLLARFIPTRVLWMLAIGYGLVWLTAFVGGGTTAAHIESLLPAALAAVGACLAATLKRAIRRYDAYPVSLPDVRALSARAARHRVLNPMFDAQGRTHDIWRVGHIREAHAVIDRMAVVAAQSRTG